MKRIVVGMDGSVAAHGAAGWAAALAGRLGAELLAVRVVPIDDDARLAEAHRELDGWAAPFATAVPAFHTEVRTGPVAEELVVLAAAERADLLVVGPKGTGGLASVRLGSVSAHLVHHTTVPVAVVPITSAPMGRLVVGVDGSPGSLAAVRLCAGLAPALGIFVSAVLAHDPLFEWVGDTDPRGWRRAARAELRRWAQPMVEAGAVVNLVVDRDIHPVAALARELQAGPGAVGVVGARGLGAHTGLRLGRVPLQLLHQTGAPVIVVPAD